jgi:hypothetical protein
MRPSMEEPEWRTEQVQPPSDPRNRASPRAGVATFQQMTRGPSGAGAAETPTRQELDGETLRASMDDREWQMQQSQPPSSPQSRMSPRAGAASSRRMMHRLPSAGAAERSTLTANANLRALRNRRSVAGVESDPSFSASDDESYTATRTASANAEQEAAVRVLVERQARRAGDVRDRWSAPGEQWIRLSIEDQEGAAQLLAEWRPQQVGAPQTLLALAGVKIIEEEVVSLAAACLPGEVDELMFARHPHLLRSGSVFFALTPLERPVQRIDTSLMGREMIWNHGPYIRLEDLHLTRSDPRDSNMYYGPVFPRDLIERIRRERLEIDSGPRAHEGLDRDGLLGMQRIENLIHHLRKNLPFTYDPVLLVRLYARRVREEERGSRSNGPRGPASDIFFNLIQPLNFSRQDVSTLFELIGRIEMVAAAAHTCDGWSWRGLPGNH